MIESFNGLSSMGIVTGTRAGVKVGTGGTPAADVIDACGWLPLTFKKTAVASTRMVTNAHKYFLRVADIYYPSNVLRETISDNFCKDNSSNDEMVISPDTSIFTVSGFGTATTNILAR